MLTRTLGRFTLLAGAFISSAMLCSGLAASLAPGAPPVVEPAAPRLAQTGAPSKASSLPALPSDPTDSGGKGPEAPAAAATAPAASFVDIPLRSRDGHEFKGSYYAPATSESGPGVLIIPNLGYDRASLAGLSSLLAGRGYRVLAMDNSGQARNISRGPRGVPVFAPLNRKVFDRMLLDLPPAVEALKHQPGVAPQICVIGFGIGGNLALQHAGTTPEIGALALVMPGFGCEEFDNAEALSLYGKRPLVLIESKKRIASDLSRVFKLNTRVRNDGTMEQIVLPRDPGLVLADLGSGQEGTGPLMEWLARVVPTGAR